MEHACLLLLPKHLRLEIWRYVLTDPSRDKLVLRICRKPHGPTAPSTRYANSLYKNMCSSLPQVETSFEMRPSWPININLLMTSHSVYEEALPILYHSVKFCPWDLGAVFPLFLQGLSSFAQSHVRYIKLYIHRGNTSPFYWPITCSEIARLNGSLRQIEVEGDWPLTSNLRKRRAILCPLLKINASKKFVPAHDHMFQQLLVDAAKERETRATLPNTLINTETEARTIETEAQTIEHAFPTQSQKGEQDLWEVVMREEAKCYDLPPATDEMEMAYDLGEKPSMEQFEKELTDWDFVSMESCSSSTQLQPESKLGNKTWTDAASMVLFTDDDDDGGSEGWEYIDKLP